MRFESLEGFLIWIVGFFGSSFQHHAILKGGMVLRLLDSPRSTNDADFVFVPYANRKEILDDVRRALGTVEGLEWSDRIDSRAWRILLKYGAWQAQVEITVAASCPSIPLSTAPLARLHGQTGAIVRVMDLPVALSHKLAAWNERRLWRDVHDLWFLHSLRNIDLDLPTLAARLEHVVPRRGKPRSMTFDELSLELRRAADEVDATKVLVELGDTLPSSDFAGIEQRLATTLSRLALRLAEAPAT